MRSLIFLFLSSAFFELGMSQSLAAECSCIQTAFSSGSCFQCRTSQGCLCPDYSALGACTAALMVCKSTDRVGCGSSVINFDCVVRTSSGSGTGGGSDDVSGGDGTSLIVIPTTTQYGSSEDYGTSTLSYYSSASSSLGGASVATGTGTSTSSSSATVAVRTSNPAGAAVSPMAMGVVGVAALLGLLAV